MPQNKIPAPRYADAAARYAAIGVDTAAAIAALREIPLSIHCWQGDDVRGFDSAEALSGGIAATGNFPGRARTPDELMADLSLALSYIPGKHKLNLHASYAIFEDEDGNPLPRADRDEIEPRHFARWVDFARKHGLGIDFNPTFFSHPLAAGLTLSSADETIRSFWVRHAIRCLEIAEYFAGQTGQLCLLNIWIPDGFKDIPADRLSPRKRFAQSLDEILAAGYDKNKVAISLESKVFGIGYEAYTVGSAEFCVNYAASRGILPLMDMGHYHPTETVSDKISAMLLFTDRIALHLTRAIRWDSDHIVLYDDELREVAKEIIAAGATGRMMLGLDFFDASKNRIAAYITGARSVQKALLYALLTPHKKLAELQDQERFTELMLLQEEQKTMPLGDVWEHFCAESGIPAGIEWFEAAGDHIKARS